RPWRTRLVSASVPATEGDMEHCARDRGIAVTHVAARSGEVRLLADLRTLWNLYRLFCRERPVVVHTHTAKAGTLGRLAALLAGVPVRIHSYHGHVLGGAHFRAWKTRLFLEIERQLARGTQQLVVPTRAQAREMAGDLRVAAPERFAVVPPGLELGRFRDLDRDAAGSRTRASLGLAPETLAVGIVGRMVPIKNHELFLEAVAALRKRSERPVRGIVVGAGEREAHLRALAAQMGLESHLLWLGWRRDLPELYAALDVLALTSHAEGLPVVILEALAAGTPVVARNVGGVREILTQAGAGRVMTRCAGGEAWAVALRAYAEEAPLPDEVRDGVVARHSVARLAAHMDALYRQAGAVS
ncbi:MAG: glycosyltransferase, partial [Gemmatimonadota bacterium]